MFGKLEGEAEYTIGFTGKSFLGRLFGGSDGSAPTQRERVNVNSEASVRAGVNRVRADMRTVATGLEAYSIDNNTYPPALVPRLTTPIAYLSHVPADPFSPAGDPLRCETARADYTIWSIGPDQADDRARIAYDATNGSVSQGDIVRRKSERASSGSEHSPAEQPAERKRPKTAKVEMNSEASVRGGVNRARADMRAIAIALEAYMVDFNAYPPALAPSLTTPISYITGVPGDPFSPEGNFYRYDGGAARPNWKLWSVGPDQKDEGAEIVYDATNGTFSAGDVVFFKPR